MNEDIIQRAYVLKEENKSDTQQLMETLEQERLSLTQENESLQEAKQQLEAQQLKLEQEQERFQHNKEVTRVAAEEKARQIIEDAKEQADIVIEQLKQLKSEAKEHELMAMKAQWNQEEEEVEEESVLGFKDKDYVRLKNLGYHGEVLSIKGNRATVFANGMKMNVKTSELEYTQRPVVKKVAVHSSKRSSSKAMSGECNIIGMHVEEALICVDKYLDSALFSKMYTIRLIHGHGTGALRKAIHAYLKNNKHVNTYRLGGEGEGGLGATIVELKRGGKNG